MTLRPLSWLRWSLPGLLLLSLFPLPASSQDEAGEAVSEGPSRPQSLRFLDGLRARGYFDLASDYLKTLRDDPQTPAELKPVLEFEEGRGLLDEATKLSDLERRRVLLEEARARLSAFAQQYPNHALAPEALVQLARLLLERGQTAVLQAAEADDEKGKAARLAEARTIYAQAREAFDKAIEPLKKSFESYPKFLAEDDPRRADRDQSHVALMDAELQRALVDYDDAQTLPADNPDRTKLLDTAQLAFHEVYTRYRTQLAGFFAHMWEAKCLEEKGDLGPAMAIYNELMEHRDPALRPLQRKVAYFRVIVHGKREEYALAADRAAAWMSAYPDAARTTEGVGVRFLLAKYILAQLPKLTSDNDRQAATRRATDLLVDVVRYYSPFKSEAIELLKKYRPSAASSATAIANLSYDDAISQAEAALSTEEYDRAIALLKQAGRGVDARVDSEKANRARYYLAYASYAAKRYYEAAAVAEFLARRYPSWGLSPKAAEIGQAAWSAAYTLANAGGARSTVELNYLTDLAEYTARTWPNTEQGDSAQITLGDIKLGLGRYEEAAAAYEGIRDDSPRRPDAEVKAGDAHWRNSLRLRSQMQEADADAQAKLAQERLESALATRRKANASPTDAGLIRNLNALAEVHRASGRAAEAIALLEPAAKALDAVPAGSELASPRIATQTILLRSYIANGQADQAIAVMGSLQKSGGEGASLTPLYFELGRALKEEIATLEKQPGDASKARLESTRKAYVQFLEALASSTSGQTYDSLIFAGESLLAMERPEGVLKIAEQALASPELKGEPETSPRRLRAELLRARALRLSKQFAPAMERTSSLLKLAPRMLEPMMEQGYLYEDWARATKEAARWNTAYSYWSRLGQTLARGRPRPIQYYEAQYHAAVALQGLGRKAQALQTLKGVMTLSPSVGNSEWKAKYQALAADLSH